MKDIKIQETIKLYFKFIKKLKNLYINSRQNLSTKGRILLKRKINLLHV